MGHNFVIFGCNDAIGSIERDPEGWWKKTWHHLNETDCRRGWTSEYGFGSTANGFFAVWNQHADHRAIIIVGGNMAQVVHQRYGNVDFHEAEGQVFLLREWAAELGYEIRKASDKKISKKLERVEKELTLKPGFTQGWRRWYRWLNSLRDHLRSLVE